MTFWGQSGLKVQVEVLGVPCPEEEWDMVGQPSSTSSEKSQEVFPSAHTWDTHGTFLFRTFLFFLLF